MATGSYLSIITLNVNVLNAPTKRQRLAEWGNGSTPLEDPLFWCQSDSWEQADDTKWVISAELNTEVSYKVRAGGSGRQLSAAADSARYFPAPSTLTSFLLVV